MRIPLAARFWPKVTFGAIADGLCVLHRCDNMSCVRPSHLFLGTQLDNMRDASRKGRMPGNRTTGSERDYSKLNDADVRSIRRLRSRGVTYKDIAARLSISRALVWQVLSGNRWSHVL